MIHAKFPREISNYSCLKGFLLNRRFLDPGNFEGYCYDVVY